MAPQSGVGIGWRSELAADLLMRTAVVDFVEVTAEACVTAAAFREARAVAEAWPVVVHGVKTSLGSAEGFDAERAKKLGDVARAVRASVISEHVAFVRSGGVPIGHLTAVPFSREAVRVVARNVDGARRMFPDVPLLLENVARSIDPGGDTMDEGDFHAEVARATGCDLLLDVGNLYANAKNVGRDPKDLLLRYPLDRVAMLHVAGGILEDGFYYDTHGHAVPSEVYDLVAETIARTGGVPIVLERDSNFPPFQETETEIARLREATRSGSPRRRGSALGSTVPGGKRAGEEKGGALAHEHAALALERRTLAAAQTALAKTLTAEARSTDAAVARAQGILKRKRVDDALPLLPRLAAYGESAFALAVRSLEGAERPSSMVAVKDALRIARTAEQNCELADAARADALLLRARFSEDGDRVRPRVAPFARRDRGAGGITRWVWKGLGANAKVRLIERRDQR
jgi:uncharacterized protein